MVSESVVREFVEGVVSSVRANVPDCRLGYGYGDVAEWVRAAEAARVTWRGAWAWCVQRRVPFVFAPITFGAGALVGYVAVRVMGAAVREEPRGQ